MCFHFLGDVLDYHISLSNPYPEDRHFNFELSDKKIFKSICICCSLKPACSQSQPSFLILVVWKTFKLDAAFVSGLQCWWKTGLSRIIYLAWCINPITCDYFLHLSSQALSLNPFINPRYERIHDTSQGTAKESDELILMPLRLFISWRRGKCSLLASEMTEWTGDPVD